MGNPEKGAKVQKGFVGRFQEHKAGNTYSILVNIRKLVPDIKHSLCLISFFATLISLSISPRNLELGAVLNR